MMLFAPRVILMGVNMLLGQTTHCYQCCDVTENRSITVDVVSFEDTVLPEYDTKKEKIVRVQLRFCLTSELFSFLMA